MSSTKRTGRTQLLLVAAVFMLPLLVAFWLYFGGSNLVPEGRSNHGSLLEPIVNLPEALPELALADQTGDTWVLLHIDQDFCDEACKEALYTLRQSRKMLGKEMDRVTRVFLHGASAPDTLFLADEHDGLITMSDDSLAALLDNKKPAAIASGGFYLIDPLGNLVLYFAPSVNPRDMVDDIKHLLRLSHIG